MHLVHTRSDLADNVTRALDPNECLDKGAYCGLVVIGILFHVGSENNTVINVNHHSFKTTYLQDLNSNISLFFCSDLGDPKLA